MNEQCKIVPWYNSEEWRKVYDIVSSSTSSKDEALSLLLIWKARSPSLPSGIESTLSLLQVFIQDTKDSENMANDQLLRLAYSSAIMRFVNHMLDTETAKGTSLYHAAKNLGVPDWIIDLRHDTAHSNNLPPLTLLREACVISLDWLRKHYWDKHREHIKDYVNISVPNRTDNVDGRKVVVLMNFVMSLGICAYSKRIKKISEIPDADLKETILNDTKDLFGDLIDISNLKTVSVKSLINLANVHSKKYLNGKDAATFVNEALLGDESLFLSKDFFYFGEKDYRNKNVFKMSYVQHFEVILTLLHRNELILDFILGLIKVTQCNESGHFKAWLAAMWVSEILIALKKTKCFLGNLNKMDAEEMKVKRKNELRQLYHHWYPNDKGFRLLLDLQSPVPSELTDINFLQPIVAVYNPYLNYFVKDLLNLVEPTLPDIVTHKICQLAKLVSVPEKFLMPSSSKIYKTEDFKMRDLSCDNSIEIVEEKVNMESCEKCMPVNVPSGVWRLASREHNWSACPIGQLPWLMVDDIAMET